MTIAEGSSKQIEGKECDDDVEVLMGGRVYGKILPFFTTLSEDPQSKEMMMMLKSDGWASVWQVFSNGTVGQPALNSNGW